MPVFRNTTARYASSPAAVNLAPTSAGAGASTVKLPSLAAELMAARPAVVPASCVLVTTSTLAGAAAFGGRFFAEAVAGTTRARLARARPKLLLPILLLLLRERPFRSRPSALS